MSHCIPCNSKCYLNTCVVAFLSVIFCIKYGNLPGRHYLDLLLASHRLVVAMEDGLGGAAAGAANVTAGHPFDTVKVRMQTAERGAFRNAWHCAQHILRHEGVRSCTSSISTTKHVSQVHLWIRRKHARSAHTIGFSVSDEGMRCCTCGNRR